MNEPQVSRIAFAVALTVLLATIVFAALVAGSALADRDEFRSGNVVVVDEGSLSPKRLPRHGTAPATAHLIAEISTADGSHPPALETVDFEVERSIVLDPTGLPVCRRGEVTARATAAAMAACGPALVGSGEAEVEVAFPEQPPFRSTGPVRLFYAGTRAGVTTVLLHAYVDVPAPTAIVVAATVTRPEREGYGLHIVAPVPRIAGGSGSVTGFELTIGRRFSYRGERRSFLRAGCPSGRWRARGEVRFADATELHLAHVWPCTPTG